MQATATEVKNNFGYYLKVAQTEDVDIVRKGVPAGRLIGAKAMRMERANRLIGIARADISLDDARAERRLRFESAD